VATVFRCPVISATPPCLGICYVGPQRARAGVCCLENPRQRDVVTGGLGVAGGAYSRHVTAG
jgi:hypothetical protein